MKKIIGIVDCAKVQRLLEGDNADQFIVLAQQNGELYLEATKQNITESLALEKINDIIKLHS